MLDSQELVAEEAIRKKADRARRRIAHLNTNDSQFRTSKPDPAVLEAARQPGLRIPEILQILALGYARRPAVGVRKRSIEVDASSGRPVEQVLPEFDLLTYGELWDRVRALASALTGDAISTIANGDFLATIGFASADYLTIDLLCGYLGLVAVPLQHNASGQQLASIVAEVEPRILAASVEYVDIAVDTALKSRSIGTLILFDYRTESGEHRTHLQRARETLRAAGHRLVVVTLNNLVEYGRNLPPVPMYTGETADRLALVLYTSGSTGSPKGAMYTERMLSLLWLSQMVPNVDTPVFNVTYLPLNHLAGRLSLASAFQAGGISYFVPKSDLSTVFEDWLLARPTELNLVPRVVDMLYQRYHHDLQRRMGKGQNAARARTEALTEIREHVLGGRVIRCIVGTAPLTADMRQFIEACFDVDLHDGYGLTEIGGVARNGIIARPPVIDYKLVDVPELGYFTTDRPHPRGELLVKSYIAMPGYFKRPDLTAKAFDAEGYYRTGDVMAEVAPDHLVFVDRRNNVLKLSQGEFVATSRLEAVFGQDPLIGQIYIYGNSERPHLLAVVVPSEDARQRHENSVPSLKAAIARSLSDCARNSELQSYEVPIDFIIEDEPFSTGNGLLSGIGKLSYPKLKDRYRPTLERMYEELDALRQREIHRLHASAGHQPVLLTIQQAAQITLGTPTMPDAYSAFTDLGGDSLSALTFADLLRTSLGVEVSVGEIVMPGRSLRQLADHLLPREHVRVPVPSMSAVHSDSVVEACDLTLDKFIDHPTLAAATKGVAFKGNPRVVLLTGATGYLGRFLCLEWLERLQGDKGTLICLIRGADAHDANRRLEEGYGADTEALSRYRQLASQGLEVVVGDVAQSHFGLSQPEWDDLADRVDLIVHSAAFVNHLLPYRQLFGPNVVGTAEVIRLAISRRRKPVTYISSAAVGYGQAERVFAEDGDIRKVSPSRQLDDTYANGYVTSKWAGEVLLREASDLCNLPVRVFRSDLILAHSRFAGQVNITDAFTRLILSLLVTGVAPDSFYSAEKAESRINAHFDGLPADFVAAAITELGSKFERDYHSYNIVNPHEDAVSLDVIVDWLIDAGEDIQRIDRYDDWFTRFDTAVRGLPEPLRKYSVYTMMDGYQKPQPALRGSAIAADMFAAALRQASNGPSSIPHITPSLVRKYATDLRKLGLASSTRPNAHSNKSQS